MRTTTWTDRRGTLTMEHVAFVDGGLMTESKSLKSLDGFVKSVDEYIDFTLEVEVSSSGWYDPGRIGGRPENDYPPEGDDERTVVSAVLRAYHLLPDGRDIHVLDIPIPEDRLAKLADELADEIEAMEIDTSVDDRDE